MGWRSGLTVLSVILFVSFFVVIGSLVAASQYKEQVEQNLKRSNETFKCLNPECKIIFRRYQSIDDKYCPNCEIEISNSKYYEEFNKDFKTIAILNANRDYPFAPKLTYRQYRKRIKVEKRFATKQEIIEKERVLQNLKERAIEEDLKHLELVDEQFEIWERIQMKKLEEYERKAAEIKNELERMSEGRNEGVESVG